MPEITDEMISKALDAIESDENLGICLSCGHEQCDTEPDAQNYECGECGNDSVFGAEEIILMR